jgi:hypothetical protein
LFAPRTMTPLAALRRGVGLSPTNRASNTTHMSL